MRRIAAALALVFVTACESSGDACSEPTTFTRPQGVADDVLMEPISQCQFVGLCMQREECIGEECARECAAEVFGSEDCGCCGPECDATCDAIIDAAVAVWDCNEARLDCHTDEREMLVQVCIDLNFEDRTES